MADVWLARRVSARGFSCQVVLKCISPGLEADERVRRMLRAEAELAGRLRHPNIPEAYELESLGDRECLVLEYVDGVSLQAVLEAARHAGKQPSEGFCCHAVASVALALEYAHGVTDAGSRVLGIIHRDVKPPNVVVAASGVVKLLDFGVAYSRMERRDRTETGMVKGTCAYFSPEQARGEALDGRSDLFSLGIVLVELLTGERPFEAGNDLLTIGKIGECDAAEVEAATAKVPVGLREVCRKALGKSPSDRFQVGGDLARTLREYLVERGVVYAESECASELRGFGLDVGKTSRLGAAEGEENGTADGAWGGRSVWAGEGAEWPTIQVEEAGARQSRDERVREAEGGQRWRWWFLMLAVAIGGLVLGGREMFRGKRPGASPQEPPVAQSEGPVLVHGEGMDGGGQVDRAPAAAGEVAGNKEVAGNNNEVEDLVVVRPKKRTAKTGNGGMGRALAGRDHAKAVGERRVARVVSLTLARGTFVRAKLGGSIDAKTVGAVEAVVTEDVMKGGSLLVPSGSGMLCRASRGEGGRVGLACDRIRTATGVFSFSGVGVGEGGHAGLRVVDSEVPAGTPFVVYVSAAIQ
jgi:serine/threonine-protein kinase